jgi:WD40 repeat protein
VLDTTTREIVLEPAGHLMTGLLGLAYSPDGRYLATAGGSDRSIRIWNAASGDGVSVVQGIAAVVGVLAYGPDGRQLAAAQGSGSADVWDPATGRLLYELYGHTNWISHLAYSPDGTRLASASLDRTVKVWDAAPSHEWLSLDVIATTGQNLTGVRLGEVTGLAFRPTHEPGQVILASSAWASASTPELVTEPYGFVHLWDIASGRRLQQWRNFAATYGLAVSADGTHLAMLDSRGLRVRDLQSGKEVAALPSPRGVAFHNITFHPDGNRIAISDCGGRVRLWDPMTDETSVVAESPQAQGTDPCLTGQNIPLAFSLDGRWLAVAGPEEHARLYDLTNNGLAITLTEHGQPLFSFAFSPDGKHLATGSDDTTVILWDITSGAPGLTLQGHSQGISALAFSPDGSLLASGSWDGLTKVWDVASAEERLTLFGQTADVNAIAFSPDGKYLAAGGSDGMIQVYLARLEDLIALAKERVTRTLTTEECQKYLRLAACPAR